MQILVTDGGPHPSQKWALASARQIVPLAAVTDPERMTAAMRLQADVAEILDGHHSSVQDAERAGLSERGDDHFAHHFAADSYVEDAIAEIQAAAVGTPWEAHYADPTVQAVIAEVLEGHFRSSSHVERMWHADRNPESTVAQAFKARHHGVGV
jgi:hypothetical protein